MRTYSTTRVAPAPGCGDEVCGRPVSSIAANRLKGRISRDGNRGDHQSYRCSGGSLTGGVIRQATALTPNAGFS